MTSNHVLGIKAVLGDGEVVTLGGDSLESVGPDLVGLFVGTEGLFGIALEITLRLLPRPEKYETVLAAYSSLEAAGEAVTRIVAAGMLPGAMEIMDRLAIEAAEAAAHADYPAGAEALLIVELDAVVTNAAGCGSGMHEYPHLFSGQTEETDARVFARQVKDVTVFLDELGLVTFPALPQPVRLAYHDACHLAHAQGVTAAPRRLLSAIPNVSLVEIPESELCCGSAGTYNLEQPEIAATLAERKARNILSTGCEAVATGNIGCLVQVTNALMQTGKTLPVMHTMMVLDQAYRAQ
jgi:glycolate oxidase iron-sulfur subunit